MKKLKFVIAIALVAVMFFTLTACGSKLPSVKKAFEAEGYKLDESSITTSIFNSIIKLATEETTAEGKEPAVKTYMFKKDILHMGLVLEFSNSKELKAFYDKSSETVKGFVKDISESDFINDNCMLISLTSDMYSIFKKA